MTARTVTITNGLGLHARAAAKFVRTAGRFASQITVRRKDGRAMDGKSIMGLLLLAASRGTELTLMAEGPDEGAALDSLCALVAGDFSDPI